MFLASLIKCVLFKSLSSDEIKELLNGIKYTIKHYDNNQTIAIEYDECNSLGIIIKGNIEIHKSFSTGKVVTINHFDEGNIFGEALVFSGNHTYPATLISTNITEIMYISREDIVQMMSSNKIVLHNFMGVLSNRILMLNERLTNLSYDTVRKKITNILLLEFARQRSLNLTLPYSRKKMAELLNIPRPSLSRELMNMKEDGLIDFYKNKFKIIDIKSLENSLI